MCSLVFWPISTSISNIQRGLEQYTVVAVTYFTIQPCRHSFRLFPPLLFNTLLPVFFGHFCLLNYELSLLVLLLCLKRLFLNTVNLTHQRLQQEGSQRKFHIEFQRRYLWATWSMLLSDLTIRNMWLSSPLWTGKNRLSLPVEENQASKQPKVPLCRLQVHKDVETF